VNVGDGLVVTFFFNFPLSNKDQTASHDQSVAWQIQFSANLCDLFKTWRAGCSSFSYWMSGRIFSPAEIFPRGKKSSKNRK
jgi:hypothetical protein